MIDTNNQHDPDQEAFDGPSKTSIKKEMLALQSLGEAIVKLTKGEFEAIPIADETLADAIAVARKIKHREGLRRQMQYIGKLMRKIDISEIEKAYRQLQAGRRNKAQEFQRLEQWRDQLITEGPGAAEKVLAIYPKADRQHLRQLLSNAKREQAADKAPTYARKLFRHLQALAADT